MTPSGLATCIFMVVALPADSPREQLSLNGPWEVQIVKELDTPPQSGEWTARNVPGYLSGTNYQRAWFRRSFTVPKTMRGKRLKLHFGGVKYNSRVYVNGRHVGGCFGGYRPFEVDVTDAVRPDGPNQLAVGCCDWTGIFTPGKVDFDLGTEWNRLRRIPRDKILAPIGGLYGLYGIWDDVTLQAYPPVYVKDLFIKPSVRRGELVVDYTVANESATDAEVEIRSIVEDGGNDVFRLPSVRIKVPPQREVTTTVRQAWSDPHHWSHVDPYLYHLRTELSTGDVMRTRFGFREFWTEDHHYYLNGTKINLLATSWWPPHGPMSREEVRERWEAIKRAGCVAFRTHTQPWRSIHYDVADELGLLMIIEGAVWNDESVYRINDPVFWDNYAAHLEAMVNRDKNRPSVVMWSLENEFYGGRMNDEAAAKADLVRMGRLVKDWDPTRPMFYESDGDPGGVADCIGIHYPHEYPHYTCWPNEAYWLSEPQEITHQFRDGEDEFFWRKNKPLYVGEFLWLPSADPSWHTVFFGDDAYLDYRRYRNLGKAESWKMQILGYRHHEVAGISPWTVIEGGSLDETNFMYRAHQYAYQHIAAYCHDHDSRFYSGEEVKRRVEIFNDVLEASDLKFAWTLSADGKVVDEGGEELKLQPAGHRTVEVVLRMPEVERRTAVRWSPRLERRGEAVFEDAHEYAVLPSVSLPQVSARVGLFDPAGTTKKLFDTQGFHAQEVARLDKLQEELDVLIIGASALEAEEEAETVIGHVRPERAALADFVKRGGRVLVLEQDVYPAGLFDIGLTRQRSTMTFPTQTSHPALEGVKPEDLKFWRGDHMVSANEPPRPASGAGLPIVVSGSAAGIDHAPLLERPIGRGTIVHSQLKLIEKFNTEPAAARILHNLLAYLASYQPRSRKTGVGGDSEAYRAYLRSLGLRFDDLTENLVDIDLSDYSLVLCREPVADMAKLRDFVQRGGNLLVHRAAPETLDQLRSTFQIDLVHQPHAGPVQRAEGDDPLLEAITREDVYWLGQHEGIGWAQTPRAQEMADGIFTKTVDGKRVKTCEVEAWEISGQIVEHREPGITFATTGSASAEIDFPASGTYVIGALARGTPCDDVYPIARVSIDDEPFGIIPVSDAEWRVVTTFGRVEKGRHKLSIAYINDGTNAARGEDRNLYVDKVLVAYDEKPSDLSFLTSPPAVAVVHPGRGTLVIDQLRWDTEAPNARKAARYASSLLTALGGDFTPRLGVAVECEAMAPQEGIPHYKAYGTYAAMACTGHIKTPIRVAAGGRYLMEIVASGTQAGGEYPIVAVRVGETKLGQVQLATGGWRPYPIEVELTAGTHELYLIFTNDANIDGDDRNLRLDKVVFYKH